MSKHICICPSKMPGKDQQNAWMYDKYVPNTNHITMDISVVITFLHGLFSLVMIWAKRIPLLVGIVHSAIRSPAAPTKTMYVPTPTALKTANSLTRFSICFRQCLGGK